MPTELLYHLVDLFAALLIGILYLLGVPLVSDYIWQTLIAIFAIRVLFDMFFMSRKTQREKLEEKKTKKQNAQQENKKQE